MKRAQQLQIIEGLQIGRDGTNLSHLQFVDGTIIFCPPKSQMIVNLRRLLDCYQLISGLKINYAKSGIICFGRNIEWIETIANKLGCQVVKLPTTYLGIPLGANLRRVKTWEPILNKIQDKLAMWKSRCNLRQEGLC